MPGSREGTPRGHEGVIGKGSTSVFRGETGVDVSLVEKAHTGREREIGKV